MNRMYTLLLFLFMSSYGMSQETMLTALQSDVKKGDVLYAKENYRQALAHYLRTKDTDKKIKFRIARCYFYLKDYEQSKMLYEKMVAEGLALSDEDLYLFAEALAAVKDYNRAIEVYKAYQAEHPNDELVIRKIWRLDNVHFTYEDSLHYAVRPTPINSSSADICATFFKTGIVFMSNRKEVRMIETLDARTGLPFYNLYFSMTQVDSMSEPASLGQPFKFHQVLGRKFHVGPVCFYDNYRQMVFAASSDDGSEKRPLHLYFARFENGQWEISAKFPFNSSSYSLTHPTISSDGQTLYFASDMGGGFGGMDIYRSVLVDGNWTTPVNVGEVINTRRDEVFPFLHKNSSLYFSSDGHPGLGGLDIFKSNLANPEEVEHLGFPINTHHDEFGIAIDSLDMHGYFSSNRQKAISGDDIFEFDMDLQTYPLLLTGLIKFKEHSWSDSSQLQHFPNARLYLIDNIRNVVVEETSTDRYGNFSVTVPYFSKYRLRIIGESNDEHVVSLEVSKHRRTDTEHEIVIVKDAFRSTNNLEKNEH
jgi:tetratricopeptide (TPR) repeat protein